MTVSGIRSTEPSASARPADRASPLSHALHESIDSLRALRDAWLHLQQRSGWVTSNADPDRMISTLAARGDAVWPHVVTFGDPADPRAMIVARRERRRVAVPLGYLRVQTPKLSCLDVVYGGLLVPGDDPGAAEALVDYLTDTMRRGPVDHVMINHLPHDSAVFQSLTRRLGKRARLAKTERHWALDFAGGTWESVLATFSKKHRYNIRRADSKLVEHFGQRVSLGVFSRPDQVEEFIHLAAAVAAHTYQAKLGAGFADTPMWREILRQEAAAGRLRCYLLVCDDRATAFQVGTVYGKRYHLDAIGYLPELAQLSPGTVLLLRSFKELSDLGVREIDYGFGDAEYKRIYGSRNWEESTVHLYGLGLRPVAARWMEGAGGAAEAAARKLAGSEGVLKRVKKKWRAKLSKSQSAASPGATKPATTPGGDDPS